LLNTENYKFTAKKLIMKFGILQSFNKFLRRGILKKIILNLTPKCSFSDM